MRTGRGHPVGRRTALAISVLIALTPSAASARSKSVRAEFQRLHPCPSTGMPRGACPGYVADHIAPLCAGGADAVANLQWQTIEDAKIKDREERAACRTRPTK
jgi:hypothetical protein